MAKRKSHSVSAAMKTQQNRLTRASNAWWALTKAERKRRKWSTFNREYLKGNK